MTLSMLLGAAGHEILVAENGTDALTIAQERHPDAILLDLGLPKMTGFQVARKLREDPNLKDILIIAVTGYGQEEDRRKSSDAGFDAHLVKPVDYHELEKALQIKRGQ